MSSIAISKCWKGRSTSLVPNIHPVASNSKSRNIIKDGISTLTTPISSPLPSTSSAASVIPSSTTYPAHPVASSTPNTHSLHGYNGSLFYPLPNSNIEPHNDKAVSSSVITTTYLRRSPRVTPKRSRIPSPTSSRTKDLTTVCPTPTLPSQRRQHQGIFVPPATPSSVQSSLSGFENCRGDDTHSASFSFSSAETFLDRSSSPGIFFDPSDTKALDTPPLLESLARRESQAERETESRVSSTITIIEEGREWWGFGDGGVRRAATALGVAIPVACHEARSEDVEERGEQEEDEMAFWHGNGRMGGCVVSEDDADEEAVLKISGYISANAKEKKRVTLGRAVRWLGCGKL